MEESPCASLRIEAEVLPPLQHGGDKTVSICPKCGKSVT